MNKADTASYLVSIHTLLEAQSKGAHSIPSQVLAQEYEREWANLKKLINEDQENETRNGKVECNGDEARTDSSSSISRRSVADRDSRGHGESS